MAKTAKPQSVRSDRDGRADGRADERGGQPDPRLVKLVRALARQAAEEDFAKACRTAARGRRARD